MKLILSAVFTIFAGAGCASHGDPLAPPAYICQCGESCAKCNTTSHKPGTCACGKPLVAR